MIIINLFNICLVYLIDTKMFFSYKQLVNLCLLI